MNVGTVGIRCPQCDEVINVPVTAELTTDENDRQWLNCEPDMADLWLHSWTCPKETA